MVGNLGTQRILWMLTAFLSLVMALVGVINPGIYSNVVSNDIIPAVFGQDLMTIVASIIVLLIAIKVDKDDAIKQLVILGITGYFFYAYGIYVIERIYNVLYYVYLCIFGLSFWSILYGILKIRPEIPKKVRMSNLIRNISAGFSLFVAGVFTVLWIVQLFPLIMAGDKIEFLYSIYILDLCFIMPAFFITGIMAIGKAGHGLLLLPAMFILGFTLIFSLVVSEVVKPFFGAAITAGGLVPSFVLSMLFLFLATLLFHRLKTGMERN